MLNQVKNIFIVGIKGVAMANLALILKKMGKSVTGSDVKEEFITDELLKKNKIKWQVGFSKLPDETDLVIYSAAHGGTNNPQVIEARKRGIKVISQAQILGEIMQNFKIKIAVCGSHGKTTTASLLAYSLIKLGKKPSYLVGAPSFNHFWGGDYQNSDYFVVEADEYGVNPPFDKTPKFNFLKPDYIICTNIDFDHPDVYKNLNEIKKAFFKFFDKKKLFLCAGDKNLMEVAKQLPKKNYLTFSESLISHTAGVGLCLKNLGFKSDEIKSAMKDFSGAKRRFEKVFYGNDIYLFDDYGHHPAEIRATILAAKERFPGKRIIVIFQPHTYSRTVSLLPDFAQSLSLADKSFILPIFPSAREKPGDFQVSSSDIIKLNPNKLTNIDSKNQLFQLLTSTLQPQDIVFTMGAGDVYKLKDDIIKIIQNSKLKIEKNKDLFSYLTIRIHIQAEYFFEAKTREDLIWAKKYSIENNIPLFFLGGGSNLAPLKNKISGLVVHNLYIKKEIVREEKDFVELLVSSGYPVSRLVAETVEAGWEGFEYHKGLPGTVGGAIYMNSKWSRPINYFGQNLLYAYILDKDGRIKKVEKKYFQFAYDYSILQKTKEIVLEAVFRLKKTNPSILKKRAQLALTYRKKTQPFGVATSGCFFRNVGTTSAGYLIDKAGLKGFSVGDYTVSNIHANFIINKGNGKPNDLKKLLNIIKERVKEKFGVELEEEVVVL